MFENDNRTLEQFCVERDIDFDALSLALDGISQRVEQIVKSFAAISIIWHSSEFLESFKQSIADLRMVLDQFDPSRPEPKQVAYERSREDLAKKRRDLRRRKGRT